MAFHFIIIPINDSGVYETELNSFLASYKVLNVDRRWVEMGSQSFWSFCIDYLPHVPKGRQGEITQRTESKDRIDYREKLAPDQFAVFSALRDLRKEIATQEAVPVYTIFTNDQLAQMVLRKVTSKTALETVDGVGEARIVKYGDRFIEAIHKMVVQPDATERQSV